MSNDTEKLGFKAFVSRVDADMKVEILMLSTLFESMVHRDNMEMSVNRTIISTILADELVRHTHHILNTWSTKTNKGDLLKLIRQMHHKEASQLFDPSVISIYMDIFVAELKASGLENFSAVNTAANTEILTGDSSPTSRMLVHQLLLAGLPAQLDAYRKLLVGWSREMGQPLLNQ